MSRDAVTGAPPEDERTAVDAAGVDATVATFWRTAGTEALDAPPLAASLPVPLALIDRDMRFRWVNAALATALNRSVAELQGSSWYDFCPSAEGRRDMHRAWFADDAVPATLDAIELPPTENGPQYARVRVFPRRDDAGHVQRLLVVAGDDSARVAASQRLDRELQASRERLDLALAGAHVGIWSLDLGDEPWVSLDSNCARLAELPPAPTSISLTDWQRVIHRDDRARVDAWLAAARADPGAWREVEYRHVYAHDRSRWLLLRGLAVAAAPPTVRPVVTGVVIDVSARKDAEFALRRAESRQLAVARMMSGYVYEARFDSNGTLRIAWADSKFEEIWRCDVAEFNRRGWNSFVHPHDRVASERRVARVLTGERSDAELRVIDAEGRTLWLRVAAEPLTDPETGAIVGFIGMGEDITERKRLTESIRAAALHEQERIGRDLHDGLGQVLTGISFLVRGMQTSLERGQPPSVPEVQRIADLVKGAIESSRTLARGLSPLRLDGGLAASLADLGRHAREVYGLETTCSCPAEVDVDASSAEHLYRIAQEALTNVVRHAAARRVDIRVESTPNDVTLMITDDGCGVPERPVGRGMGLRTMAHRADLIGGVLTVERGVPRGTRVTCALAR